MQSELLTNAIQHQLQGTCLFYPGSARDILDPVMLFAPAIRSFWFADISYFAQQDEAASAEPALKVADGFEFLSAHVQTKLIPEVDWIKDPKYRGVEPCIRSEAYKHLASGAEIFIHRTRRRGPSALRSLIEPLGVFFFRGDSDEGGSGTLWLTATKSKELIVEVLARLVDHGLIATDGSLCSGSPKNQYSQFAQIAHTWRADNNNVHDARFHDSAQRRFALLGQVSTRWEMPTLLWRVTCGHQPCAGSNNSQRS